MGAAAALWGCIAFFTEYLHAAEFTSLQIVTVRAVMATVLLFVFLRVYKPSVLYVEPAHYKYFVGTGIISVCFFQLVLFYRHQ